ncbi:MAG TPA: hypothetical protein VK558_15125, partial [Patescibacteria group bacterium]|nr:hypothetical protein [Patescibacteria group bacterium]
TEIQADARPRADSGDARLAAAGVLPMRPDPKMYAVPVATADWEPLSRVGDCILVTPSYPSAPGDLVYVRGGATPGLYRLVAGDRDEVYLVTPTGMPLRFLTTDIEAHRVGAIVFG